MHYFLMNIVEIIFSLIEYFFYLTLPISEYAAKHVFASADVKIDGSRACDIKVKNDRFYSMLIAKGQTGFFDAYINAYFECDELDLFFNKMYYSGLLKFAYFHPYRYCKYLVHRYFDVFDIENTRKYVNDHYDGKGVSDMITMVSDENVQYSVMMLEDVEAVENANREELKNLMNEGAVKIRELYAKKLKLKPGMKVLDIGCGFGALAKHIAERYDVHVTGVTITKAMAKHAREACKGLNVDILNMDYREVSGKFDRIVSIEMFEHVGENHHREYFQKAFDLLKDDGLLLLQSHQVSHRFAPSYDPLFENSLEMYCYFPRIEEICLASKGLFIIEDVQNHGYRHGVTTKAMMKNYGYIKEQSIREFGETTYRRGSIYGNLAVSLGLSGYDRVYDYVMSKNGLRYAYTY